MNDHAVATGVEQAGLKLGQALDLDQAHAAGPTAGPRRGS